jgi:hypothetical protein
MADYSVSIDVHGEDIIVSSVSPGFIAVYYKLLHEPQSRSFFAVASASAAKAASNEGRLAWDGLPMAISLQQRGRGLRLVSSFSGRAENANFADEYVPLPPGTGGIDNLLLGRLIGKAR